MTLCEYAIDYGDAAFKQKADAAIARELPGIANEKIRVKATANMENIRQGKRDFYF
jgi:2-iminoacetate synthase